METAEPRRAPLDPWRVGSLIVGALVDLGLLYALIRLRWDSRWIGPPKAGVTGLEHIPAEWWRWGTLSDALLSGPDAGNWAANVEAALAGRTLDLYRMPVYTYLTAWMTRLFDDVVFAGHMVNHAASALVPVLAYVFGRATSGRAPAFAAAALTALTPALLNSAGLFGVDPSLQLAVMLLVATGFWALSGPWWVVPIAGVAAGICAGAHYLGLLFPFVIGPLLLTRDGRWWSRGLAVVVFFGIGAGVWRLLFLEYPPLAWGDVAHVYAEGVIGSSGKAQAQHGQGLSHAVALVLAQAGGAWPMAVQRGLSPLAVGAAPWGLLVGAFWLGVIGPWLRPREGRLGWDWRPALTLAGLLAPLAALEAARAPERYAFYSIPLVYLCVARGLATPFGAIDTLIQRRLPRWPRGLLAWAPCLWLLSALLAPLQAQRPGPPPPEEPLQDLQIGTAIREEFTPGDHIVSNNQTLHFYSGRKRCLLQPCANLGADTESACARTLLAGCSGRGDLPYVIEERPQYGFANKPDELMDTMVTTHFERVCRSPGQQRSVSLYKVDRATLQRLAEQAAPSPAATP